MSDDTQTLSEPFALALCSLVDIFADQKAPARERVQAAAKLLDVSQSLALFDREAIIAEIHRIRSQPKPKPKIDPVAAACEAEDQYLADFEYDD